MSDEIVFRYKATRGWGMQWFARKVDPEKVFITVGRPEALSHEVSERYSGVQILMPEQERIWMRIVPGDEFEIEDFQTPDMGEETFRSLRRKDGRCDEPHV